MYLDLENKVSLKLCERVQNGLINYNQAGFNSAEDSLDQRCNVQCINNYFANKLLQWGTLPADSKTPENGGNPIANAHFNVGKKANNLLNIDNVFDVVPYIFAENYLRAGAYINCYGVLTPADTSVAIQIIKDSISEIFLPGIGSVANGPYGISYHLDLTVELFNKMKSGDLVTP